MEVLIFILQAVGIIATISWIVAAIIMAFSSQPKTATKCAKVVVIGLTLGLSCNLLWAVLRISYDLARAEQKVTTLEEEVKDE